MKIRLTRNYYAFLIVVIISTGILYSCEHSYKSMYEEGRTDGYEEGRQEGYDDGYQDGLMSADGAVYE